MTTRIYVSQRNIRANRLDQGSRPVVSVLRDGLLEDCHEASVRDETGREVCRVVYRQDDVGPVHVWVETDLLVVSTLRGELDAV